MLRILVFIAGLTALLSCNKSSDGQPANETLAGTWNYTQHYYSPGSGFVYVSTDASKQWIIFGAGGSFASNTPQYQAWNHYEQTDSSHLRFSGPSQAAERFFFRIDSVHHTLNLSSADHMCIEGCGDIFKR